MNGETKSYRLNEPMSWQEFKSMPDDIKVMYIKLLREKFNVPGRRISDMMGVDAGQLARKFRDLGIAETGRKKANDWDMEGWYAWCGLAPKTKKEAVAEEITEEMPIQKSIEQIVEEALAKAEEVEEIEAKAKEFLEETPAKQPVVEHHVCKCQMERKTVVPMTGNMVFEGLAEDVLETVRVLLGGAKVHISVTWDVVEG